MGALALGLKASTPMALALSAGDDAHRILALVADANADRVAGGKAGEPGGHCCHSAHQDIARFAGRARGGCRRPRRACDENIIRVEADTVARFADDAIGSRHRGSEASVPLASGTSTRFVVFRDAIGGSPVAIILGSLTSGRLPGAAGIPPA